MTTAASPFRARMRAVLGGVIAIAASAALAPAAHAGTYPLISCNPPGLNVPGGDVGPWSGYATNSATAAAYDLNCSASRSDTFGFNGRDLAPDALYGVQLSAPDNITLRGVKAWWRVTQQSLGSLTYAMVRTEAGVQPGGGATPYDATAVPHDFALPSSTKQLRLHVMCSTSAAQGCSYPTNGHPIVSILGTQVTLHENVQPAASIDGGSLTSAATLKGTKTLSYTASDADSGIERVEVLLDGIVVATQNDARDLTLPVAQQTGYCTYTNWNACPTTRSGTLNVNTSGVPDGAYELSVRAIDAAGNQKTVAASQPAVIDNVPDGAAPVAPTPIPVPGPNGKDGANGRDGANAVLTINGTNGSAGASLSAAFSSTRTGIVKSKYGKQVLITGELRAPSGKPISGARLWVMQQDKMLGAKMVPAGEVVTDSAGKFRYVTTAVRSRTVRFGYRTHLESAEFSQTTDISLGVIAKIGLASSRKSVRNGQSVTFNGRVAGAPATARKVVELQVKKGSTWMTFRSTRLRNGRFSEKYRFTRTRGRTTYVFRARVRQEAGFPFLTGVSPQAKVTVR